MRIEGPGADRRCALRRPRHWHIRAAKRRHAGGKDGLPLTPRSHLGPFLLRPRSHSLPCPLCPIPSRRLPLSHSHSHLGMISPVGAAVEMPSTLLKEPAGMAELRAQTAELTLEKAAYDGRASCTRRTASCTSCHVSCNAHLSYAAVRISICRAAHQQRPCQLASTARTGGESAICTSHVAIRWKTTYTCQYLVHNAGVRLRSAHCRRSTRTSRRQIRSLKLLSAAQVMLRCEMVAARGAHSCASVHAHAQACMPTRLPRTRLRVRCVSALDVPA